MKKIFQKASWCRDKKKGMDSYDWGMSICLFGSFAWVIGSGIGNGLGCPVVGYLLAIPPIIAFLYCLSYEMNNRDQF